MTTSVIQLKANRNNAKKSTGAKTAEGKRVVATNALKHGVFATVSRSMEAILEGKISLFKPAL